MKPSVQFQSILSTRRTGCKVPGRQRPGLFLASRSYQGKPRHLVFLDAQLLFIQQAKEECQFSLFSRPRFLKLPILKEYKSIPTLFFSALSSLIPYAPALQWHYQTLSSKLDALQHNELKWTENQRLDNPLKIPIEPSNSCRETCDQGAVRKITRQRLAPQVSYSQAEPCFTKSPSEEGEWYRMGAPSTRSRSRETEKHSNQLSQLWTSQGHPPTGTLTLWKRKPARRERDCQGGFSNSLKLIP